ncbi:MAG: hypothetical protein AAF546_13910 [Verrucomicrobiota bacterium]
MAPVDGLRESLIDMVDSFIGKYHGTHWQGTSELWTDPLGNEVDTSDCSLKIESGQIVYTWSFQGEKQQGSLTFGSDRAVWQDSWHQAKSVDCKYMNQAWGIVTVEYTYPAPPGPDWGWRIKLSLRPDQSLVLQMTNLAPWGEEGRAVRMIFKEIEKS